MTTKFFNLYLYFSVELLQIQQRATFETTFDSNRRQNALILAAAATTKVRRG
jgi:hypothetical protein